GKEYLAGGSGKWGVSEASARVGRPCPTPSPPTTPGTRAAAPRGYARPPPLPPPGPGPPRLRAVLERLGAIQIDAINVVPRSHELVLHARAGPHDRAAFDRLVYRRRAGFEYWGHAASFLPIDHFRLCLPRMRRRARGDPRGGGGGRRA